MFFFREGSNGYDRNGANGYNRSGAARFSATRKAKANVASARSIFSRARWPFKADHFLEGLN